MEVMQGRGLGDTKNTRREGLGYHTGSGWASEILICPTLWPAVLSGFSKVPPPKLRDVKYDLVLQTVWKVQILC